MVKVKLHCQAALRLLPGCLYAHACVISCQGNLCCVPWGTVGTPSCEQFDPVCVLLGMIPSHGLEPSKHPGCLQHADACRESST